MDLIGKRLFGRPLRLRVLLWVLEQEEPFFQSQAAVGVEYSNATEIAKILRALADVGMVRVFGRPVGNERQYYAKTDSVLWEAIEQVHSLLTDDDPGLDTSLES